VFFNSSQTLQLQNTYPLSKILLSLSVLKIRFRVFILSDEIYKLKSFGRYGRPIVADTREARAKFSGI